MLIFLNNLPALRSEDLQIANSIWLNQNEVLEVVPTISGVKSDLLSSSD